MSHGKEKRMNKVIVKEADRLFMDEVAAPQVLFGKEDYERRLALLVERMRACGLSHVLIYGDGVHYSSIEYFSGYDCRFEEALFIVDARGKRSIVVGNEGVSQTYPIPYDVEVYLYQNFSLQGQPRDKLEELSVIFGKAGIGASNSVGLAGYKYFEAGQIPTDPLRTHDVPSYVLDAVIRACGPDKVVNFTRELTGIPEGIRMRIRSAKEIAWVESAGNRSAAVVQRILKRLKPGMSEVEAGFAGEAGFDPVTLHPLANFGEEKVRVGLVSPTERRLRLGEGCSLCYGTRGSLTSRAGVAAYDEGSVAPEIRPLLGFYKEFWEATVLWLEEARVGASCARLYDAVMGKIGQPEYGVSLNPTHYSGSDEWTNSPMSKDSKHSVMDGSHIQVDIIASRSRPQMTAICEDCVVIAGKDLRMALKEEYPQAYERVLRRQEAARSVLGIRLHDDVLPMSNLNFAYFPYMLDTGLVFAMERS